MKHTRHMQSDGLYHVFATDRGTVVVRVRPVDEETRTASLVVSELHASLAAIGMTDVEARDLPEHVAARNAFGTGLMLRILRAVRDSMPEVKQWAWERKTGVNPERLMVRSY